MTTTNTTATVPDSPLAGLTAAEAALAQQIDATARALDAIGTSTVEEALARLEASATAACARLTAAFGRVTTIAAGVVQAAHEATAGVAAALAANVAGASKSAALPTTTPPAQPEVAPPAAAMPPTAEPARSAATVEVDPDNPAGAVRAFLASFDGAAPDVEETVSAGELVRRGVLTQAEADGIARQAERFAAAANPAADGNADHDASGMPQAGTTPTSNGKQNDATSTTRRRRGTTTRRNGQR